MTQEQFDTLKAAIDENTRVTDVLIQTVNTEQEQITAKIQELIDGNNGATPEQLTALLEQVNAGTTKIQEATTDIESTIPEVPPVS